jgi:hypothetical protein
MFIGRLESMCSAVWKNLHTIDKDDLVVKSILGFQCGN